MNEPDRFSERMPDPDGTPGHDPEAGGLPHEGPGFEPIEGPGPVAGPPGAGQIYPRGPAEPDGAGGLWGPPQGGETGELFPRGPAEEEAGRPPAEERRRDAAAAGAQTAAELYPVRPAQPIESPRPGRAGWSPKAIASTVGIVALVTVLLVGGTLLGIYAFGDKGGSVAIAPPEAPPPTIEKQQPAGGPTPSEKKESQASEPATPTEKTTTPPEPSTSTEKSTTPPAPPETPPAPKTTITAPPGTPTPSPPAKFAKGSGAAPGAAGSAPTPQDTPVAPVPEKASFESDDLAKLVGTDSAPQDVFDRVEHDFRQGKGMTRAQLGEWVNTARADAKDPKVKSLMRRIEILNDDTISQPVTPPGRVPDGAPPKPDESGADTLPSQGSASGALFARALRAAYLGAFFLVSADAQISTDKPPTTGTASSPAALPEGLLQAAPTDQDDWQMIQKELANPDLAAADRAHYLFKLADLLHKYSSHEYRGLKQGLDYCQEGHRVVEKALKEPGLSAEKSRSLQTEAMLLSRMTMVLTADLGALATAEARGAETQARQAAAEAKQARADLRKVEDLALGVWRTAVGTRLEEMQQRLKALKQRTSDQPTLQRISQLEQQIGNELAQVKQAASIIDLAAPLQKLGQEVLDLENLAAAQKLVPIVVTRQYAEDFLGKLQLPKPEELVWPAGLKPLDSTDYGAILNRAGQEVASLRALLDKLGPQGQFSPEQSQEVAAKLRSLLYDAMQLETRKQVIRIAAAATPVKPGVPGPAVQPVEWAWMQVYSGRGWRRWWQLVPVALPAPAPASETLGLPAELVTEARLAAAVGEVRQGVESVRESSGQQFSTVRELANQVSRGLGQVQAQAYEDREQSSAAREQVRRELGQRIDAALLAPRALPAEQANEMVGKTMQGVLKALAAYGYAPRAGAPGSSSAPLEPGHVQPDPLLAQEFFTRGYATFFAGSAQEALEHFAEAVKYDSNNAAYRYFLGLSLRRAGRDLEAQAQVSAGRKLETWRDRAALGRLLERVQGADRAWLERYRLAI